MAALPMIVICPNCSQFVEIVEINCSIFRHGILKVSGQQIDPHTPKSLCELYVQDDLIYGCGKPFRIIEKEGTWIAEICDYI
jgi:hypothetical protein